LTDEKKKAPDIIIDKIVRGLELIPKFEYAIALEVNEKDSAVGALGLYHKEIFHVRICVKGLFITLASPWVCVSLRSL
jgi:hypothetical protein